jgi:hypothetical protein
MQGVTGVSNHRIKGDVWETAPSLPPLKLSREGSFSSFTAHCRCRSPFLRTCASNLLWPSIFSLQSASDRQRHGTAQGHRSSEVF